MDLQPEKYGLSFDIKKSTTSGWALGDENVIGIRAFNSLTAVLDILDFKFEKKNEIDYRIWNSDSILGLFVFIYFISSHWLHYGKKICEF